MLLLSLVIIVNYGCQPKQKNNSVKLRVIEKKESIKKKPLIEEKSIHLNDKNLAQVINQLEYIQFNRLNDFMGNSTTSK